MLKTGAFGTSGVMAQPAGLPCGALGAPSLNTRTFGTTASSGAMPVPSRPFGTAGVVAPAGWLSKEAAVHPTHAEFPAGLDSYVDNTMRLKPLLPRYGKTREIAPTEIAPTMRVLAPDLLSTSKGLDRSALLNLESPERMSAVLPAYSPNAALFCQGFGPERRTAGFLRTPIALGGATYVDSAASFSKTQDLPSGATSPSADGTWKAKKFAFDQTANLAHIPVAKAFS